MNLKNQYISKFTDSLVKKYDKYQALKDLGNKKSIPMTLLKCKERLTEEYKFWLKKLESNTRDSKLQDIKRDIDRVKKLESQVKFSVSDIDTLEVIKAKYGL